MYTNLRHRSLGEEQNTHTTTQHNTPYIEDQASFCLHLAMTETFSITSIPVIAYEVEAQSVEFMTERLVYSIFRIAMVIGGCYTLRR